MVFLHFVCETLILFDPRENVEKFLSHILARFYLTPDRHFPGPLLSATLMAGLWLIQALLETIQGI